MSDGTFYATLSHRKIRGWGHLRKVEQHNARTIDTPSRDSLRPWPIELVAGDGDMVARTEALLTARGVSHALRKNAVLAYEDVYGASPGYWSRRFPGGWERESEAMLAADPVVVAALDRAKEKYGDKLVSVRLHLDEKSPHVHVVSVPLVTRMHKKRGRKRKDGTEDAPVEKTTLYSSCKDESEGGRGGTNCRLEIEHDEWAAAVAHLGLVRGKRGSELSEAERRERRTRDVQATREGEERARQRRERERDDAVVARLSEELVARDTETAALRAEAEKLRNDAREDREQAQRARHDADSAAAAAEADRAIAVRERLMAEQRAEVVDQLRRDAEAERTMLLEQARAEAIRVHQDAEQDIQQRNAVLSRNEALHSVTIVSHRLEEARLDSERSSLIAERQRINSDRAAAEKTRRTGEQALITAEVSRRAADARQAEADLLHRQLSLLGRAISDDGLRLREDDDRRIIMDPLAMNEAERQAYSSRWSAIAHQVAASFAAARAMAAKLRERLRHVALAKAEIMRRQAALAERETEVGRLRTLADDFVRAWTSVPMGDRIPTIATAIERGTAFMKQVAGLSKTGTAMPKGPSDDDSFGAAGHLPGRGVDR